MRRTADLQRLQPLEAADAMLGMDDEVALDRAPMSWMNLSARLRLRRAAARQPVAQQVVLAEDVDRRRDEAALERQDGDGRAPRPSAPRPSARPG